MSSEGSKRRKGGGAVGKNGPAPQKKKAKRGNGGGRRGSGKEGEDVTAAKARITALANRLKSDTSFSNAEFAGELTDKVGEEIKSLLPPDVWDKVKWVFGCIPDDDDNGYDDSNDDENVDVSEPPVNKVSDAFLLHYPPNRVDDEAQNAATGDHVANAMDEDGNLVSQAWGHVSLCAGMERFLRSLRFNIDPCTRPYGAKLVDVLPSPHKERAMAVYDHYIYTLATCGRFRIVPCSREAVKRLRTIFGGKEKLDEHYVNNPTLMLSVNEKSVHGPGHPEIYYNLKRWNAFTSEQKEEFLQCLDTIFSKVRPEDDPCTIGSQYRSGERSPELQFIIDKKKNTLQYLIANYASETKVSESDVCAQRYYERRKEAIEKKYECVTSAATFTLGELFMFMVTQKRNCPTYADGRKLRINSSGRTSLYTTDIVDRLMSCLDRGASVKELLDISSYSKLLVFVGKYSLNLALGEPRWPEIQSLLHSRPEVAEELEAKKKRIAAEKERKAEELEARRVARKKDREEAKEAKKLQKRLAEERCNKGRWSGEEHRLLLEGLKQHGEDWNMIAAHVKTRNPKQVKFRAQNQAGYLHGKAGK